MPTLSIRTELLTQLHELNKRNKFLPTTDFRNLDVHGFKMEIQKKLAHLKSISRIYNVIAFILLAVTGVTSFMKVLELNTTMDLNKGALLIFLTVTSAIVAFGQQLRIAQLEKQFILIEILEKADSQILPQSKEDLQDTT